MFIKEKNPYITQSQNRTGFTLRQIKLVFIIFPRKVESDKKPGWVFLERVQRTRLKHYIFPACYFCTTMYDRFCKYCDEVEDKCGCGTKPDYMTEGNWRSEMMMAKEIAEPDPTWDKVVSPGEIFGEDKGKED